MEAIESLVLQAHKSGVPEDQLTRLLNAAYVPLPWQLFFHAAAREADKQGGPVDIGVGGARGPGKSHAVFSQVAIDDCQRVDGLKGLFLRQTALSAQESFEDLIHKTIRGRLKYRKKQNLLVFPNGSRILLGGFHDEKDIEKYIGIEYDFIVIEELNQLSEEKVKKLRGSLRTSKSNWRPRLYTSFNPGGMGHAFVKGRYVEPFREKREKETRFVPSTYKENPFLNVEYTEYLEGLTGDLGKAWREGEWDLFAGQFFSIWRHTKHVVEPFELAPTFKRFRAYDYGHESPACCKWYAVDYDGRVWVYREKYWPKGHKTDADRQAEEILRLSGDEVYDYSVADPAIFAATGMVDKAGGQTIAETFARHGIIWIPASNRRVDGWSLMNKYLYWDEQTQPKIKYFSTCSDSIRTIPNLVHDELHPEDVDTDGEDHAADVDRYFLTSLHERKATAPMNETQRMLEELKQANAVSALSLNDFYGPPD